ncbi:hypothetical protein KAM338_23410 [Aeromonas caviae]|uniref:Uncharacterized protein n=1 Tax=Aeromonas caviae TaxID=648 RepID=A0A6M4NTU0_AERCA|nr:MULTISPECIES: hypothetical protein [Aeromonas]QJR99808.1 Hypothetical protein [Aeromonas caviae]QMV81591.1 Hypothetical protein [Aeromonas caviae]QQM77832.1 hypothetical protein JH254_20980 [Aeromonas caviae]QQV21615.1 hypothetical protein JJJ22_20890 [Aeromonas caviae]UJQ39176.1 hypothetical protein L1871_22675 [Aeromonas caviae]
MSNRVTRYLFRVAISIDQLGNTLLGGRPDETISGNVGYNAKQGKPWALKAEKIINFIMRSPTHCRDSIEYDERKKPLRNSW